MNKYFWSFNDSDEVFTESAETIQGCVLEAAERAVEVAEETGDPLHKSVFIGTTQGFAATIDADDVIERLQDQAYDECGESSDGWLDGVPATMKDELGRALTLVLQGWAVSTENVPHFGNFECVHEYDISTGVRVDE